MPPLVPRKPGYNKGPSSLAVALARQAKPATDKPAVDELPMTASETAREIDEIRGLFYSALRRLENLSGDLYSRNVKDEVPF